MMTEEQKQRYSRHLVLNGIGEEGQEKLLRSKVLIVGAGGLGSPVAMYLSAAGVGNIGIADGDIVSISNLQRQIIHRTQDVGMMKVNSAERAMKDINPKVNVMKYNRFLRQDDLLDIVKEYDFVVDCTDNFAIKYLINDVCVKMGKPFSMGGINRFQGQVMTCVPGTTDYRSLFPEPPERVETCEETGVLGCIAGICGSLLATEVIKYLTGSTDLLTNTLLIFDAKKMEFEKICIVKK